MAEIARSMIESSVPSVFVTARLTSVAEMAQSRLYGSGYHTVRCVSCEFHEGVLILHGRTPSYYLKQVAQEVVKHVRGVEEIVNRIEVARMNGHRDNGRRQEAQEQYRGKCD